MGGLSVKNANGIAYREALPDGWEGTGKTALFLHGYPSFWYQWKDQMAEMGRDHLAVGLDMRGYNLSSRPEGLKPYKMTHLVEDVRQVAERIAGRNQKFVLVAHDWGAIVAWVFAMAVSSASTPAARSSARLKPASASRRAPLMTHAPSRTSTVQSMGRLCGATELSARPIRALNRTRQKCRAQFRTVGSPASLHVTT